MFTTIELTYFIRQLNPAVGVVLVGIALTLILQGHRLHRPAVILSLSVAGFGAVWILGKNIELRLILAIMAAVVMGVGTFYLSRLGIAILSGLAGMGLTIVLVTWLGVPKDIIILFGVGGFIALGGMAFVNWKELAAFVTSLEGGILLVAGAGSMMTLKPMWFSYWHGMITHNSLFIPIAVFFPTVTGFCLQLAALQKDYSGAEKM